NGAAAGAGGCPGPCRASPPVEARPGLVAAVRRDGLVLRELRRRGACMVRQDPQPRAYRETLRDVMVDPIHARNDAVLLVGAVHDVAVDGRAVLRAHPAEPEVALLLLRAAVAAHRHPARIHDPPALVTLVSDAGSQHGQGHLVRAAHTD